MFIRKTKKVPSSAFFASRLVGRRLKGRRGDGGSQWLTGWVISSFLWCLIC